MVRNPQKVRLKDLQELTNQRCRLIPKSYSGIAHTAKGISHRTSTWTRLGIQPGLEKTHSGIGNANIHNVDLRYISTTRRPESTATLSHSSDPRPRMTDLRVADMNYQRLILQKEEARLAAALSSIRSQLNELVPISWLPPEILEEIFEICVSWLYGYQKPKHRLAWTQVCCSWRRISLNSSRLWQRIDLCDSRFADEFLLRSKQAPLSIVSSSPLKLTTDNLTVHSGRLQSIDVYLFPDDMTHLFSSIGRNLPTLRNLSLRVPPVSSTLALDLSLPLVRRLILDCVAVRWDDCQNLTHLSLRGLSPECCPSIRQLHDIFAASPNLEYVRLESLTPSSLDTTLSQPIPLIHLKDMIISAKPCVVRSILTGVYLGPDARLQLYVSLSEDLHTLFPGGLPYLTNHSHHPIALDIGTVRLSRHGAHFLRHGASAWSEDSSRMLFSISSACSLSTRVCGSLDHFLNVGRVVNLELNTGVLLDIPLKALQTLFEDLRNLETLRVAFNDLEDLFSILQALKSSSSAGAEAEAGVGHLYLPRLVKLSFSKPSDLWWHFSERWVSYIVECLKTRRLHNLPIQTLEFLRCHGITPAVAKGLEGVVSQVIVSEQIGKKSFFDQ